MEHQRIHFGPVTEGFRIHHLQGAKSALDAHHRSVRWSSRSSSFGRISWLLCGDNAIAGIVMTDDSTEPRTHGA